jgi:hypothetical protein
MKSPPAYSIRVFYFTQYALVVLEFTWYFAFSTLFF